MNKSENIKSPEVALDALNENFDYCNTLAHRINLLVDAITALAKRVEKLEKINESNV